MSRPYQLIFSIVAVAILFTPVASAQVGSITGTVSDEDLDFVLSGVRVVIAQTSAEAVTSDDGRYVLSEVEAGQYTLVFSKAGYNQQVATVVVAAGQVATADVEMSGDFAETEDLIVEDLQLGGGTEAEAIQLRLDSPALVDAISAELMSRIGASDAASAVSAVAGATVQDGKFAVVRGLPDRYVNSQMNGVRLPTADEDKRAVQLDQFPTPVIETIAISKTFLPDQQGDASGGAVNVKLKGIPTETLIRISAQLGWNEQAADRDDFLSYEGGGVNLLGNDRGGRDIPAELEDFGGAVGVSTTDSPLDYKWSVAGGTRHEFDGGLTIGAFGSLFYERDSSFYDNGIDDKYWVETPGAGMTPRLSQESNILESNFQTSLFDVTEAKESVQWGGLGTVGLETENHQLSMTYLYTRTAEDTATLAEDTRGKEYASAFFGWGSYDVNDPMHPGNLPDNRDKAPYLRAETLRYQERTTQTLQFRGEHTAPFELGGIEDVIVFKRPRLDWTIATSDASLYEPDKRQFGSIWQPESFQSGIPPFIPDFIRPSQYLPRKPAANFTVGNFQRIWKTINESSDQQQLNFWFPFDQWSGVEGFFKFGVFKDQLTRTFDQETFANFGENPSIEGVDFDDYWSEIYEAQGPVISESFTDIDYRGDQEISAWYAMVDMPLSEDLNVIGGFRSERTKLSIVNTPDVSPDGLQFATWFPPDGAGDPIRLNPGDADVAIEQTDLLPAVSLIYTPAPGWTVRASYAETIARQTFKELTPILQQEFLGGDIFIGNPELQISNLQNWDLRLDFAPQPGSLLSASWFRKKIVNPIETVQRVANSIDYTTAINYPFGQLHGVELELRQDMAQLWERLEGLSIGANATFIQSNVFLPEDEYATFETIDIQAPMRTRDMTNTPEYLYNLFLTYDAPQTGTQFSIFYAVKGDTLVAGAGATDNFIPNVYAEEYGTLNFRVSQMLGEHLKLTFQAKNLTNPEIREVYRSEYIGADVLKTSYTSGVDYSIGLSASFNF